MNNLCHSGEGRNPANKTMLLAFVLIAVSTWHESINAAELGRLFYTPQQRQQLDSDEHNVGTGVGGSVVNSVHRNYIIVNGVVQKQGGNRTVWINGAAQPAERGNDRNPASVPVAVPGKPQPVQVKVGERLMLEAPAPEEPQ